jgi:hypothetical protein
MAKLWTVLDEWQPIKTAPISEPVLVAGGDYGSPGVATQHQRGRWTSDEATPIVDLPKYWMPLPDYPKE